MYVMCPGGDPCLLEHDGKAPVLGQHAGDKVLLISAGRRPPASSEGIPEEPVRGDEAVAQVPGEEQEGIARRVLLESAVPHRHRCVVCRRRQVPRGCWGHGMRGACPEGGAQGGSGQSSGD